MKIQQNNYAFIDAQNHFFLLTKVAGKNIAFVSDLRKKLEYKKKRTP